MFMVLAHLLLESLVESCFTCHGDWIKSYVNPKPLLLMLQKLLKIAL